MTSLFTFPQSSEISEGIIKVGSDISFTMMLAEVVLSFPQLSVAVNVIIEPISPGHPDGILPFQSFVQLTPDKQSDASAPPFWANHAETATDNVSVQSTTKLVATTSIEGPWVSSIVYVASQVVIFPASSIAVN